MVRPFWSYANRIVFILCIVVIVSVAAGIGVPAAATGVSPVADIRGSATGIRPTGSLGSTLPSSYFVKNLSPWTYNGVQQNFVMPFMAAVNASGYVYVSDDYGGPYASGQIDVFSPTGAFVKNWSSWNGGYFDYAEGVAVDPTTQDVYVVEFSGNRVDKFTPSGSFIQSWDAWKNATMQGTFKYPFGIAVNASGYVYVADSYNNQIEVFTSSGNNVTSWYKWVGGTTFKAPHSIAINPTTGNVYVADTYNNWIEEFNPSGTFLAGRASWNNGANTFSSPWGIGVSASGYVYVSDTYGGPYASGQIEEFTPSGSFATSWTNAWNGGTLSYPTGVAVYGNNVYVSEEGNLQVEQFAFPQPAVTGVLPNTGPSGIDTNVIITGSGFTGAGAVLFGSIAATNVTVVSDSEITATSPAGTAGTVDVTVNTPGGTSAISQPADQFRYGAAQTSTVGVFRNGVFFLASSNTNGGGTVNGFTFGTTGDVPVVGDWTNSGIDRIGIFRNGVFYLASSNTNNGGTVTGFTFGTTGDVPVAGHWSGPGSDTIGVFRKGTFYLASSNTNNGGTVNGFTFGTTGDIPVVGDWTGSGTDTVGVFRNGVFYLASSNTNGGGTVTGFTFGTTGDVPVVWNNNGVSTVGVFRKGTFYLASSNTNGGGTVTGFTFGTTGDKPVNGKWS